MLSIGKPSNSESGWRFPSLLLAVLRLVRKASWLLSDLYSTSIMLILFYCFSHTDKMLKTFSVESNYHKEMSWHWRHWTRAELFCLKATSYSEEWNPYWFDFEVWWWTLCMGSWEIVLTLCGKCWCSCGWCSWQAEARQWQQRLLLSWEDVPENRHFKLLTLKTLFNCLNLSYFEIGSHSKFKLAWKSLFNSILS